MNYPIEVDSGGYGTACDDFYNANHGTIDGVSTMNGTLGGCSAMAGSDAGGQEWAKQYDAVSTQLVQAGADIGESMGQLANLLNGSLKNHVGADYGAQISTPPQYQTAADDGDADSNHWIETLSPGGLPSASGGTGDNPDWWHWLVDHLDGFLWPNADTGKMRTAGQAWITGGQDLTTYSYDVDAAKSMITTQKSPEVPDAIAACTELKTHVTDLADAYNQIGTACNDYAKHVDEHHKMIEDELVSFLEWTAGIEIVGGIVSVFTVGIAEAPTQVVEGIEVANAASKVLKILRALVEIAETVATTLGKLLTKVTEILGALKKFLNAKIIAAVEKIAPDLLKNKLLEELAAQGVKHNPEDIVAIWKNADGKIMFLEKGNAKAGLAHIVSEHGAEFAAKGISEAELPSFIQQAITNGTRIGYQGKGTGRPIYEVLFHGKLIRVAITVGSNGFVVGANLSG